MSDTSNHEINDDSADLKYEFYRAIKTFCVIMIIFCLGFVFKKDYDNLLNNAGFIRFYPATTVFYQDFKDGSDFNEMKISFDYSSLSYGIFKDEKEIDRFLLVAKTTEENMPVSETGKYFYFVKTGYLFLSDSESEILHLQNRIKSGNNGFLNQRNVKRVVKNLDKNRDYTLIIDDMHYSNIDITTGANDTLDKIFDKVIVQGFKTDKGLNFSGEVVFNNDIAGLAMNLKHLRECFTKRNIKIVDFDKDKIALILAVRDFDLWAQTLVTLSKSLPDNQYSETLKLIQILFNTDVESDIVKKLNGNGVFYLFTDKNDFHPLLTIDTKQDIAEQVGKYLGFLQLTNGLKLSEKEVNKKQLNVLTSKFYPYNLSFATINGNLFLLGYQNIIEHLIENNVDSVNKTSDFYFYSDITKLPVFDRKKSMICDYRIFEIEFSFTNNIVFNGSLNK